MAEVSATQLQALVEAADALQELVDTMRVAFKGTPYRAAQDRAYEALATLRQFQPQEVK